MDASAFPTEVTEVKSIRLSGVLCMALLFAACSAPAPAPAPEKPAAPAPPAQKPYGNLAQMMRAIPFPASNTIFDAQTHDPGAKREAKSDGSATGQFGNVYGGWLGVETAAIALQETANLLNIPGRVCQNGKPVPLDREDFQKAIQGLADAGAAALKAAQSKSQEAMVEVSGTVADACAVCHEVYRDKPDVKDRCTP
jgi:hypothetical protein